MFIDCVKESSQPNSLNFLYEVLGYNLYYSLTYWDLGVLENKKCRFTMHD